MRYKFLWRTLLIVHFAKDGSKPFVSACIRLVTGYTGAFVFGFLLAKPIRRIGLPQGLPPAFLLSIALVLGFIIGGFLLLAVSASQTATNKATVLQRIVKLIPLSKVQRWLVAIAPPLLVLGMVGVFGGVLIAFAASAMEINGFLSVLVWTVGLLCGNGCLLLHKPSTLVMKGLVFIGLVISESMLLDKLLTTQSQKAQQIILYGINGAILIFIKGFWDVYHHGIGSQSGERGTQEKQLIPDVLPNSAWFMVKLWRNRRTRAGLLLALTLSMSSAASMLIRHRTFTDPFQLLLLGAILAATFGCDVRGVMRRNTPPEIVLLNGTKGIVMAEVTSVLICGLAIGLPMFMALHASADNQLLFLLSFISIQIFASLAGLFASTIFVPGSGDTGSQFFAAVLSSGVILSIPKISHFSDISYRMQSVCWLMASGLVCGVIYTTELIRRNNYGRT